MPFGKKTPNSTMSTELSIDPAVIRVFFFFFWHKSSFLNSQ